MTHILIVEDDSDICQLYSRVLTKNGYQVTGVANGQMALDAIDQNYYDLIISDIMMPVMNGYELVRELRENGCNIPVMMITAKDAFDDKRQGFLSGTDDYMVKPIDVDEMVLRVGALLHRSKIINDRSLTIGGTVMDMDAFSVTADGEPQTLPQKEFMLLYKLASYPGKILTRMLYRQRKESIERVFADAKEKHAMRYTHHRGLAAVTRWVRLKYAAINLKKLANWSWKNSLFLFIGIHFPRFYDKTPVFLKRKQGFFDRLSTGAFHAPVLLYVQTMEEWAITTLGFLFGTLGCFCPLRQRNCFLILIKRTLNKLHTASGRKIYFPSVFCLPPIYSIEKISSYTM